MEDERPTDTTPGTCSRRCAICSCVRANCSPLRVTSSGIASWNVCTSSGRVKPGMDLPHGDERPNHQPRDDQQHQGERDFRDDQRVARAEPRRRIARRSAAFLERRGIGGAESHDRDRAPNSTPVSSEIASVKSSTIGSMPISSTRGSLAGAIRRSRPMAAWVNARPQHASRESQRAQLSDSSSRAMRPRLAPSAARIASSCWRPSARTRKRFATFAQAMSSTTPTAAEENPEDTPDVAGHVLGQWPDVRPQLELFVSLPEEGDHARDVGVGLRTA